jgi:hypothetical protein
VSRKSFFSALAVIVVVFLIVARLRYSPESFGAMHDDTLYFSSAKSIAEGHGYRIASMPGEPAQTKYPALYSALLSLVWRLEPEFPENLDWAWSLNALFAILAILAAAALVRQLGAGRAEALALAGLTALHPFFVYWSNQLVSDLLFMALALGAAVLAQRELEGREVRRLPWAGVVALLALACGARTVGVAFVAGVAAAALLHGKRLAAAVALAGAAPVVYSVWTADASSSTGHAALDGFQNNFAYYASYVEHWRRSVPSWDVLGAQVQLALTETLKHPAIAVFHLPAQGFVSMPLALLSIAISVGVLNGVVTRARLHGLHPAHVAALFYLPIVLLWNYLLMERFWLPFLPLLLAGATDELARIAAMARETWRKNVAGERVVAVGFAAVMIALLAFASFRGLWAAPEALANVQQKRADLAEAKREAYRWVGAHSDSGETVISNDDALLYLYTGRQGMRPFAPLTDSFFAQDEARLERDLAGLTDTPATLGSRYWITAPDDFEMTHAPERIRSRVDDELSPAAVVFTSRDGKVRIYDLSSMPWNRTPEAALRLGNEGLR